MEERYISYPHSQDGGNHGGATDLRLTNHRGHGIHISAIGTPFPFSALPYTAEGPAGAMCDCELVPRKRAVAGIDVVVLGLGSSSRGPGMFKKYVIEEKEGHRLRVRISPF